MLALFANILNDIIQKDENNKSPVQGEGKITQR